MTIESQQDRLFDQHENSAAESLARSPGPVPKSSLCILIVTILLFLVLRGPVMFRQLPGQDEECFAVPGLTILEDGIPRIPYMPSRNRESAFYRADEMLFALPPMYFYMQAVVYRVFEPSTGYARLTSTIAGFGAFVMLYLIGRRWFRSEQAALLGVGLYAFSRVAYFSCMVARPDMLFGFWGLATLWCMTCWSQERNRWQLCLAGVCIGCGFLTHPASLIFALQAGFWALFASGSCKERIINAGLLTAVTILVTLLWMPLILLAPELFESQFGNNVFNRSGPGLLARAILPMESLKMQFALILEHFGVIQTVIAVGATVLVTVLLRHRSHRSLWPWVLLVWGGLYFHVVCQGMHPTKGYWCYTAAPLFLFAGYLMDSLLNRGVRDGGLVRWMTTAVVVLVFVGLLPGSGLRTLVVHLRAWEDPAYNAPQFTSDLINRFPKRGEYVVGQAYIFDFYRAGRSPLLASRDAFYYDVTGERYDYLICGRFAENQGVPDRLKAQFQKSYGNCDDSFACCAKVYRPHPTAR